MRYNPVCQERNEKVFCRWISLIWGENSMKKKSEPGKRQLQTAANRKKIIETARELFKENGFESTTMSDFIEATGLSNGTIYNLFP